MRWEYISRDILRKASGNDKHEFIIYAGKVSSGGEMEISREFKPSLNHKSVELE